MIPMILAASALLGIIDCSRLSSLLSPSASSASIFLTFIVMEDSVSTVLSPTFWGMLLSALVAMAAGCLSIRLKQSLGNAERLHLHQRREAHFRIDYLLQGVQGLILTIHVAASDLSDEHPSRQLLDRALQEADALILVGRRHGEEALPQSKQQI